ncbi:MAG: nuclear transport factor 2 family protein [Caulobacteraceae bacterium]
MDERAIGELLDKQACAELVWRLARGIDRVDEALLRSVFHPDATDDHGVFAGTAAAFVDWVLPVLRTMRRTQHFIGNVLIEVDGDRARGESYFIAHHTIGGEAGGDGTVPDGFSIAAGRYLDRFERRDGTWLIGHRQAVYDWSSSAPSSDVWNRPTPGWTFGARAPHDASCTHFAGVRDQKGSR